MCADFAEVFLLVWFIIKRAIPLLITVAWSWARMPRASELEFESCDPERKADTGSITTSPIFIGSVAMALRICSASSRRASARTRGLLSGPLSMMEEERNPTMPRSAFAAMRRGFMVSAGSSSAERMSTPIGSCAEGERV